MVQRFYGWKKGPERPKPFKYTAPHRFLPLPIRIDLEPECPTVYDQGKLGSCTAQAAAALAQFIMRKMGVPDWFPSRLALYWWNRLQEGNVNVDSGASLHSAIRSLVRFGVPHESLWQYDIENFMTKPVKPVWSDGYWHTIREGLPVEQSLNDIKSCLAEGYPVIFGFAVFESFEDKEGVAKTGIMALPTVVEKLKGGHAVMAVGYDDTIKMVKVRNSWGSDWGQKGYFWMPYSYIQNPYLCDDFWTARGYIRFRL